MFHRDVNKKQDYNSFCFGLINYTKRVQVMVVYTI